MPRIAVDNLEPDSKSVLTQPVEVKPEKTTLAEPPALANSQIKNETAVDKELEEKSGTSLLAAFKAFPQSITFSDKEPDEDIILLLRAHIITTLPWILATLGLIVLPLIILPLVSMLHLPVNPGTVFVFFLLWYAGTFSYAFINFLSWYFNVYIVTSGRVVDVDWYSIIYRKVSAAQISHIEDVSSSAIGVLAGVFDYGNVAIQTAAEEENFEFEAVPHPQLVSKKIQELMEIEDQEKEGR
ncbi:hypothetical protein M1403_02905 [Patescibacteria group bacterium]|nr:hypothetical protein [Patescibacteria group bacterium]